MKKIYSIAAAICITMSAAAEGYQVNLQSAKQAGMGHVGTGMKLGSEGMHFNPAGLTSVKNMEISAGVALLQADVTFEGTMGTNAAKGETNNSLSTPVYLYAGFNVWKDKLFAGISVNTPYGSGLNWGRDWAGNKLIQEISMRAFSIQPTIAYKVCDKLSLGAGLMIATGNFSMNKALMVNGDLGGLKNTQLSDQSALASMALSGSSKLGYGFNLGVLYDVTPELTIGISYRSEMSVKVDDGKSETIYSNSGSEAITNAIGYLNTVIAGMADDNVEKNTKIAIRNGLVAAQGKIAAVNNKTVEAELPLPSNITVGASYKFSPKFTLAADFQYIGWSTYDTLQINLVELGAAGVTKMNKNYKNSFAVRIGGAYEACDYATVRLGFAYDRTPVDTDWYSPETPGANKYIATAGASANLSKAFSIDLGLQYVFGQQTGTYPMGPTTAFAGKYKSTAYSATIGATYKF